jgi:hypothetical protein
MPTSAAPSRAFWQGRTRPDLPARSAGTHHFMLHLSA